MAIDLPSKGVTTMHFPIDRPLGCLLEDIKEEDPEVRLVEAVDLHGYRSSRSSLIGLALKPGAKIIINDRPYSVMYPSLEGEAFFTPQLLRWSLGSYPNGFPFFSLSFGHPLQSV